MALHLPHGSHYWPAISHDVVPEVELRYLHEIK
jgi:hypothetical protein